jgi:hypothetical protein
MLFTIILKDALLTPIIQKVILERFAHSISVPTKNVDIPSSWERFFFSIQPLQAIIHNTVWCVYREEKIQSHIYGTIQYTFDIYGIVFSLPGERWENSSIWIFLITPFFAHGRFGFWQYGRIQIFQFLEQRDHSHFVVLGFVSQFV